MEKLLVARPWKLDHRSGDSGQCGGTTSVKVQNKFTILPPSQAAYCGRRGWRWFDVDPEQPDYKRFPQYKRAAPAAVTVNAGDILYMPPAALHHVRSLSTSISFNIDFHTKTERIRCASEGGQGYAERGGFL
ncbi:MULTISPECIES: cupin-like domain-containing protein [Rhizobium]|uniref:cupin-like domain-containing protein n=1 Tax=Rhizobium TaxID=379 RepID=UPI001EF7F9AD|nr:MULTISPECIES: cupin-like domain-containing protein [Rhizobium]ULJ82400.1 cupin-like domain-containing protein [Rhizobium sp. C104]